MRVELEAAHDVHELLGLAGQRFGRARISSVCEAFACVTPSICVTAVFTCSIPVDCSRDDAAISPTMSVTRFTDVTISPSVSPDWLTSFEPASTFATESLISVLISFADDAERCARSRTSAATTAKPRPCSPARRFDRGVEGQQVGLERDLVHRRDDVRDLAGDDVLISSIAPTAVFTTWPPFSATSRAPCASCAACAALSAFCFTAEVISSSEAAVSSRLDACSCAPLEISSVAADSCLECRHGRRRGVHFLERRTHGRDGRVERRAQLADLILRFECHGLREVATGDRFEHRRGAAERNGDQA